MKSTLSAFLASLLMAGLSYAQPAPPLDGGPGGGPGGDGPPPRGQDDRGPGGHDRRDGPQGRGGSQDGPPRPNMLPGRPGPIEQMKNFLDLVTKYNEMGKNPEASAVASVIYTIDILRPRGPQAVVEKLEKLLSESKNASVQRVIRLQLADFYRQTNQPDKALEQLDVLLKEASGASN